MSELRRHNAQDGIKVAIDADLLSESLRISAERTAPESIAEHDAFSESRLLVVHGVDAAQLGPCPQHREIIGARCEQFDALRFFASCEIPIGGIYGGDVFENIGSVAQVP